MKNKSRFRDTLINAAIMAIACLLAFLYLIGMEADIARVMPENGVYRFTPAMLEQGIFLLEGVDGPTLKVKTDQVLSISLNAGYAQTVTVNGEPGDQIVLQGRMLVRLRPGVSEIHLGRSPDGASMLHMGGDQIRVGRVNDLLEDMQGERKSKSFFNGFFIFSILFALTLFAWKPSETYLLIYVLHALVFFSMGFGSFVGTLVQVMPFLAAPFELGQRMFAVLNRYGSLSLLYPLFTAVVHWLLYRVFVDDRIFGVRYPLYLSGMYLLLAAAMLLTGGGLDSQWMFFLFYFVVYLCEGCILLLNRPKEDHAAFSRILLAAWCVSFIFWLVRTLTNLGFIRYASSMGSLIAVSYTIGFLICINGKFSHKFLQADQLLRQTKHMNEHLEELVDQKTRDLKESYAHLEQVQREKNEFVSNIIHNLKTPLFSLRGYAELLGEEMDGQSEAAKEYLALVCGNVDYAQAMISHLLLFSRLEERRVVFRKIHFDLGAMLERLTEECGVRLQKKNLTLRVAVDAPLTVCGDELYLRQAVQNIVDNAIEHSPPGGEIHIGGRSCGENVQITVRDFGNGIEEDVLPHIMERCYSHHADGQKSSGLGLNITQAIVHAHGGEIRVQSAVGEGSTFTLALPVNPAEEETGNEL